MQVLLPAMQAHQKLGTMLIFAAQHACIMTYCKGGSGLLLWGLDKQAVHKAL